jgi:hypothetical protein
MNPTTHQPLSNRPAPRPRDAVRALRREVTSPIIPGELDSWARTVAARATRVAAAIDLRPGKGGLLDRIEQLDPNTAHRVEPVRERYQALHAELADLTGQLHDLLDGGDAPADEPKRYHLGETIREQLLDWCFRAETLEREARSWFGEAIYRDRGVGD